MKSIFFMKSKDNRRVINELFEKSLFGNTNEESLERKLSGHLLCKPDDLSSNSLKTT